MPGKARIADESEGYPEEDYHGNAYEDLQQAFESAFALIGLDQVQHDLGYPHHKSVQTSHLLLSILAPVSN